jgi:hypothetical protein
MGIRTLIPWTPLHPFQGQPVWGGGGGVLEIYDICPWLKYEKNNYYVCKWVSACGVMN